MDKLDIKLSAIFGISLFGTLYVISAIGLVTVGVYAILEEGVVLSIKAPLWVGGAVFVGGILTIGMVLCGDMSYLKSLILLVINGASFLLCFTGMLLLEFVDKGSIFQPNRHKDIGPVTNQPLWRSPYVIYLVYLISSVVGMVSSVVGFLYIYCILIGPVRNQQWKSYQTQTQAKGQIQDQGLDQHARTKYTFKNSPTHSGDMNQKKDREKKNDLPQSSWIYESQSIHSLAATPTRARPITKETQLKKDVMEELRHNSTFKVHRYQTRPSLSPMKPVPPPLPPISPSALASVPTSPVQVESNGQQRCTAKSLEHYPIPRKYSLRGASRRSNHGRQLPSTYRQTSPRHYSNTEGAMNSALEHHGLTDVSQQNFGPQHEIGNYGESHITFGKQRHAKVSIDEPFTVPCMETKPLQTPQHDATSNAITLKPVPVKRKCSKRGSSHPPSATLPGYDQIRSHLSNPPQDCGHYEGQCDLPLGPVQDQESTMNHHKTIGHFNGETDLNMGIDTVQTGYTGSRGNPWETCQEQEATSDPQAHPVPQHRSAYPMVIQVIPRYSQESAWETESPQMAQTQIHQLYQVSHSGETKPDMQGQQNLNRRGDMIPNPHQDKPVAVNDNPNTYPGQQRSDKPVAPPRTSPKPKLQHQIHVVEDSEWPHPPVLPEQPTATILHQRHVAEASKGSPAPALVPALHRRSSRKVHERIQAVQEKLRMDSRNPDSFSCRGDQLPGIPDDKVDHLQPRLAATNVKVDNLQDLYVTSTRL